MRQQQSGRAYNLFRFKQTPDLYCAVPEDQPLARFLKGSGWEYGGRLDETRAPDGFQMSVAAWAGRLNGFYLFHAVRPFRDGRFSDQRVH
jgi:hypothetical protein